MLETALATIPNLGLVIATVVLGILYARRRLVTLPKQELVTLVALFAVAFLLRWLLPPHSLIHENHHGYQHAQGGDPLQALLYDTNGSSHLLLSWIFQQVVGTRLPDGVLAMNALLSALAVPGMYALVVLLSRSRAAGLVGALLLAVLPLAVVLAPTEEFFVSGSGLLLVSLPLMWRGLARGDRLEAILGLVLLCLAANVREVALVLSVFVPLVAIGARPTGGYPSPRLPWILLGLTFVILLPKAALVLHDMLGQGGEAHSYLGPPNLVVGWPGTSIWAGWARPWMPAWMTWLSLAALVLSGLLGLARKQWRHVVFVWGGWLLLQTTGGMVIAGNFPSHLRHQLIAMSFLALPVGWLVGTILEALPAGRYRRSVGWTLVVLVSAAGLATILTTPEAYEMRTPSVEEYQLVAKTLPTLDESAVLVVGGTHRLPSFEPGWVAQYRPSWQTMTTDEWLQGARPPAGTTVYFVVDRVCYFYPPCEHTEAPCASLATEASATMVPSKYGLVSPACGAILTSATWTEVATLRIEDADEAWAFLHEWHLPMDLPAVETTITIAVLQATTP